MAKEKTPAAPEVQRASDFFNADIRAAAYDKHHEEGWVEIAPFNSVLRRDSGAWVTANVWISYDAVRDAMGEDGFHGKERYCGKNYQPRNHKDLVNPKDEENEDGYTS